VGARGYAASSAAAAPNGSCSPGTIPGPDVGIHPVLAGVGDQGDMLFRSGNAAKLELADTKTFDNGVIVATYRPG